MTPAARRAASHPGVCARGQRRYRGGRPRSLSLSTGRGLRSPAPMCADSLDLRRKVLDAIDCRTLRNEVARAFGVSRPTLETYLWRNEGYARRLRFGVMHRDRPPPTAPVRGTRTAARRPRPA